MGPKLATKKKRLESQSSSATSSPFTERSSRKADSQKAKLPPKKKPPVNTKQHCLFCLALHRRYFPPEIARYLVFLINRTHRAPSIHPIDVEFKTSYSFKFKIKDIVRPQGCVVGKNGNLIIMGSEPGAF